MATSGEVSIEMEQIRYLNTMFIHFIISVALGEQTYLVDAIYFSHYIFDRVQSFFSVKNMKFLFELRISQLHNSLISDKDFKMSTNVHYCPLFVQ